METPASLASSSQDISSINDNGIPMQFSTYGGGVSWLGIGLLVLYVASISYTIVSAHYSIVAHKQDAKRDTEMQKDILAIKKRLGMQI